MDLIPKIFVINLPHRTDRLQSISVELERMGLFDKMEVVPGTVMIAPDGLGGPGIADAHARCLEIAQQRGYEMIMILEDDCKFVVDKETLRAELETFFNSAPPDWNGLWFGSFWNGDKSGLSDRNWLIPTWLRQDTATVIHSRFYSQLIESYRHCRDKYMETGDEKYNIDWWIAENISIYSLKNKLCGQADDYSDRVFLQMGGGIGIPL